MAYSQINCIFFTIYFKCDLCIFKAQSAYNNLFCKKMKFSARALTLCLPLNLALVCNENESKTKKI